MAEYENERLMRIEENKRKMEEMGLKALAYEAMCAMKDRKMQKISKMKSKKVFANDDEYRPEEEDDEQDQSLEGDDNERVENIRSLSFRSKKVMASRGGDLVKTIEKPQYSTTSMASLVKTRSQTLNNQEQQRKSKKQKEKVRTPLGQQEHLKQNGVSSQGKSQQMVSKASAKTLSLRSQQEVENMNPAKKVKSKTLVAPGSRGAYDMMKEKAREKKQLSKQIDAFSNEPIQGCFDQLTKSSRKQQEGFSEVQLFDDECGYSFGLMDENEGSESSDDYVSEEENGVDPEEIQNDVVNTINESIGIQDQENEQLVPLKEKRTRGPSMCKDVHGWTINDRRPIILNGMGQPIGPDKATLDKFSRFLGTLARDSTLAPLNRLNWHQVSGKDKIWDYVKKKYIIPEEGKGYVLHSVGNLWRTYKSRTKTNHYKPYKNNKDRWKNRPASIPESHFKELLGYWNLKQVQKLSEENKQRSEGQNDRHTMGPITYARKRAELEQAGKKPPSQALMYRETRKRTPGRKYKTSDEPKTKNCSLIGRCTKKAKGNSESTVLIPNEFLQPYRAQIVKDTVGEVLKILKQVPPDMLASVAASFGDPSSVPEFANLLTNAQSSGGINDIEQDQEDEDRNNEADHDDDDLEENQERVGNEEDNHVDY